MAPETTIALRVGIDAAQTETILVRFLRDYVAASGRRGFVLGLSGGLDSAVAAALGARAIGPEKVSALVLPDDDTDALHLEDAASVARSLGIASKTVSIQPMLEAFQRTAPDADKAAIGNAKARIRMILLHAEAAKRQSLVLGTGNKSELLAGYFSKYGDGGVDIQPLGDLYKTQVRELASHLKIPQQVIDKAPTAGLWVGQTDEAELGLPYAQLDRVLLGLEIRLPPATIATAVGLSLDQVARIEAMRAATQHKRRMPLSPKIGLRTVGIDWRAATLEG